MSVVVKSVNRCCDSWTVSIVLSQFQSSSTFSEIVDEVKKHDTADSTDERSKHCQGSVN